ncbi:MAG: type I-E CRISPR-associated protein Cas7/Cse4/CasC [Frankia sp.]|nr:type I-E CRISPR-associated protein Cas7/Cse4/CasC [Frankia sp.]
MRCYVDIHILQTVPPSNLNRDDAGTPKQAVYGGVKRARVSSQAWKRAARVAFAEQVDKAQLATRTKKISELYAKLLAIRCGLDSEASERLATHVLAELGIKAGKKASETAYLLFFGRPQLERLVDLVKQDAERLTAMDDKDLAAAVKGLPVKETLGTGHPIDVALFGRMIADIPALNVDAATQVAHALSTHAVDVEFDYYTAVDDENPKEDTGAGMIGTVEFQSATLYRFSTVGLHQLAANLGGDTGAAAEALRVFLNAFAMSMPSGHQNSFAHRTTPNLVAVALRTDQPVNLVSAFEQPVRPSRDSGVLDRSMQRLAEEMSEASRLWGRTPALVTATYRTPSDESAATALKAAFGPAVPFEELVTTVVTAARDQLPALAR